MAKMTNAQREYLRKRINQVLDQKYVEFVEAWKEQNPHPKDGEPRIGNNYNHRSYNRNGYQTATIPSFSPEISFTEWVLRKLDEDDVPEVWKRTSEPYGGGGNLKYYFEYVGETSDEWEVWCKAFNEFSERAYTEVQSKRTGMEDDIMLADSEKALATLKELEGWTIEGI